MQNHNQVRKETLGKMLGGEIIFAAYNYKSLDAKALVPLMIWDLAIQKYSLPTLF